jgi:hypothetical protein
MAHNALSRDQAVLEGWLDYTDDDVISQTEAAVVYWALQCAYPCCRTCGYYESALDNFRAAHRKLRVLRRVFG